MEEWVFFLKLFMRLLYCMLVIRLGTDGRMDGCGDRLGW